MPLSDSLTVGPGWSRPGESGPENAGTQWNPNPWPGSCQEREIGSFPSLSPWAACPLQLDEFLRVPGPSEPRKCKVWGRLPLTPHSLARPGECSSPPQGLKHSLPVPCVVFSPLCLRGPPGASLSSSSLPRRKEKRGKALQVKTSSLPAQMDSPGPVYSGTRLSEGHLWK